MASILASRVNGRSASNLCVCVFFFIKCWRAASGEPASREYTIKTSAGNQHFLSLVLYQTVNWTVEYNFVKAISYFPVSSCFFFLYLRIGVHSG